MRKVSENVAKYANATRWVGWPTVSLCGGKDLRIKKVLRIE